MWSVVTFIQYLLFELFRCRDTHSIVEPYYIVLVDHRPCGLPTSISSLISSSCRSIASAMQISSVRVGCTSMT